MDSDSSEDTEDGSMSLAGNYSIPFNCSYTVSHSILDTVVKAATCTPLHPLTQVSSLEKLVY